MTKRDKVLEYLETHGSITPKEADREFSCMRLADQIYKLKKMGYSIKTEMVFDRDKFGDTVHYARYILEKGE